MELTRNTEDASLTCRMATGGKDESAAGLPPPDEPAMLTDLTKAIDSLRNSERNITIRVHTAPRTNPPQRVGNTQNKDGIDELFPSVYTCLSSWALKRGHLRRDTSRESFETVQLYIQPQT
ncbi:hypothetical protein VTL71DRAFT_5482 [Oculimacula yallundae]|uniref:Uncharacterized protein n=1 Tax=Oculimacula yallundae TaxID=86028 RepID=A0ABR4C299_9HELO